MASKITSSGRKRRDWIDDTVIAWAAAQEVLPYWKIGMAYRLTASAVSGIVYRVKHYQPRPVTSRPSSLEVYTRAITARVDEGQLAEIDALRRKKQSRSDMVRQLIEWGLEACDDDAKRNRQGG